MKIEMRLKKNFFHREFGDEPWKEILHLSCFERQHDYSIIQGTSNILSSYMMLTKFVIFIISAFSAIRELVY